MTQDSEDGYNWKQLKRPLETSTSSSAGARKRFQAELSGALTVIKRVSESPIPHTLPIKHSTRGVERLELNTTAVDDQALRTLIQEAKNRLAQSHKRVDGNERVLADGIVIDWVLDHSKYEENNAQSRAMVFTDEPEGQGVLPSLPFSSTCDTPVMGFDAEHAIVISDSDEDLNVPEVAQINEATSAQVTVEPAPSPWARVTSQSHETQCAALSNSSLEYSGSKLARCTSQMAGPREVIAFERLSGSASGSADNQSVWMAGQCAATHRPQTLLSAPKVGELDFSFTRASHSNNHPYSPRVGPHEEDTSSDSEGDTSGTEGLVPDHHPGCPRESTAERILADVCNADVPEVDHSTQDARYDELEYETSSSSDEEESRRGFQRKHPSRLRSAQCSGNDDSDGQSSSKFDGEQSGLSFRRKRPRPTVHSSDSDVSYHEESYSKEQPNSGRKPPSQSPRSSGAASGSFGRRIVPQALPISPPAPEDDSCSVNIPKANFARARRVLVYRNPSDLVVTIAMRGDVQFIQQKRRISARSMPVHQYQLVEDAILVGDTVVTGYSAGPCQISLIPLTPAIKNKMPRRVDLDSSAHSDVGHVRDGSDFLSGGYDKRVIRWNIRDSMNVTTDTLPVFHSGPVHAIGYRTTDKTVLSASARTIYTIPLEKPTNTASVTKSTAVQHIHVHPQDPNLVILEMKDLDHQIQVYDVRAGSFDRSPCIRFGRDEHRSQHQSTRYRRGSPFMSYFSHGDADGNLLVYDYRNKNNIAILGRHRRLEPIVHTALFQSEVLAYGGYTVTFWPT